jgi:hypothetical protein
MNLTLQHIILSICFLAPTIGTGQIAVVANGSAVFIKGKMIIKEGTLAANHTMTLTDNSILKILADGSIVTPYNSRIIIESDANYINLGSSSPLLEHRRTFTGSKGWRMVASPVGTTYGEMFNGFVTQGFSGTTFPSKQPNLMWHLESDTGTALQQWRMPSDTGSTVPAGKGHFQYVFNGAGITAGGTYSDLLPITMISDGYEHPFTAGAFDFGITYTPRTAPTSGTGIFVEQSPSGWNLVGNPTASTLDWESVTGWTKTNVDDAIYIWDPSANGGAGDYLYQNGGVGTLPNGRIAPYQAFWVHANATAPVLKVNNNAKNVDGTFLRTSRMASIDIPIELTTQQYKATSFLRFNDAGDAGIDPLDAYRLEPMSDTWIELFTLGSTAHHDPLVINNLPKIGENPYHLPLYVGGQLNGQPMSGSYTIRWEVPAGWPSDWNISLHDHKAKAAVNMVSSQSYSFDYQASSNARLAQGSDEFKAPGHMVKPISTGSNLRATNELPSFSIIINRGSANQPLEYISLNPQLLPNYPNPFSDYTTIRFSLPETEEVTIALFDIQGRRVQEIERSQFEAGIHEINLMNTNLRPGIYLLQLRTSDFQDIIRINKI